MVAVVPKTVKRRKTPASTAIMAARGCRSPLLLADRDGGDSDPPRARTDGWRQRAGLPPPGSPFRCRTGLLGDGQLRRTAPQERAHTRVSEDRGGRAPARRPDLRVRSAGHG